jgi:hypothetical protein
MIAGTCVGASGGSCAVGVLAAAGAGVAVIGIIDGVVLIKNIVTGSDEPTILEGLGRYVAGADGEKLGAGANFLLGAFGLTGSMATVGNAVEAGSSVAPAVIEATVDGASLILDE